MHAEYPEWPRVNTFPAHVFSFVSSFIAMDSDHPDPDKQVLWCPITGLYWPTQMIVAGHLFPWKSGQDTMDAIFERLDDELFRAENGIL